MNLTFQPPLPPIPPISYTRHRDLQDSTEYHILVCDYCKFPVFVAGWRKVGDKESFLHWHTDECRDDYWRDNPHPNIGEPI